MQGFSGGNNGYDEAWRPTPLCQDGGVGAGCTAHKDTTQAGDLEVEGGEIVTLYVMILCLSRYVKYIV